MIWRFIKGLNINVLFNKEWLTCILMIDQCLNTGLDDHTLTANILIIVSPNVAQMQSISKHDSPIISTVLSISWWPTASSRI
jgi:glycosylphosphatidylinositol transamidase (GPIT) subunit GPI8